MLRTLFKSFKAPLPVETPVLPNAHAAAVHATAGTPAGAGLMSGSNEGLALAARGAAGAAIAAGTQAALQATMRARLAQQGDDLEALLTLAALLADEDAEQAAALYARALALRPICAPACFNLSLVLQDLQRLDEAIVQMRMAVALDPSKPDYRFALAMQLFIAGQYREGFLHFDSRNQKSARERHAWAEVIPAWRGEPLAGRRILVWTDWGGLGDELLFARYLTLLHRQYAPAEIHVSCTSQVRRLFAGIEGVTRAMDEGGVLNVDCHVALLDLPALFGTDLDSVPAPVPYLRPAPDDLARWRARLADLRGLKVGLCWGSGFWASVDGSDSAKGARRLKSMSLSLLEGLADIEGVQLISLQKGGALDELAASSLPIHNFDTDLRDMADTAALACCLDLVITVDTSISHLAGGLGLPTLVLLPHLSGSFWLNRTERSPWYPSARLLRVVTPWDWRGVAARAEALLRGFAARGRVDLFD